MWLMIYVCELHRGVKQARGQFGFSGSCVLPTSVPGQIIWDYDVYFVLKACFMIVTIT
jgi:hypothetical protein